VSKNICIAHNNLESQCAATSRPGIKKNNCQYRGNPACIRHVQPCSVGGSSSDAAFRLSTAATCDDSIIAVDVTTYLSSVKMRRQSLGCPRTHTWESAHRGKWGQLTPLEKWMKKLKSENVQERAVFYFYVIFREQSAGRCRKRRYADHIFIQIYFRMHHFVVKFSRFSSHQAARGHWPTN